jgi:hypothetical protein
MDGVVERGVGRDAAGRGRTAGENSWRGLGTFAEDLDVISDGDDARRLGSRRLYSASSSSEASPRNYDIVRCVGPVDSAVRLDERLTGDFTANADALSPGTASCD